MAKGNLIKNVICAKGMARQTFTNHFSLCLSLSLSLSLSVG